MHNVDQSKSMVFDVVQFYGENGDVTVRSAFISLFIFFYTMVLVFVFLFLFILQYTYPTICCTMSIALHRH